MIALKIYLGIKLFLVILGLTFEIKTEFYLEDLLREGGKSIGWGGVKGFLRYIELYLINIIKLIIPIYGTYQTYSTIRQYFYIKTLSTEEIEDFMCMVADK